MWQDIEPVLKNFLLALMGGLLSLLSAFLIAVAKKFFDWLSAKIDNIKEITMQNKLKSATNYLKNLVEVTVTSLQQTLGDNIRESIAKADGNYTREDLLALKDTALATIKSQIKTSVLDVLTTSYENLDSLIGDMIETQVHQLKWFSSVTIVEEGE